MLIQLFYSSCKSPSQNREYVITSLNDILWRDFGSATGSDACQEALQVGKSSKADLILHGAESLGNAVIPEIVCHKGNDLKLKQTGTKKVIHRML